MYKGVGKVARGVGKFQCHQAVVRVGDMFIWAAEPANDRRAHRYIVFISPNVGVFYLALI